MSPAGAPAVARVDATEAQRLLESEDYAYIDVRAPEEFIAGHARGAYNIPIALRVGDGTEDNRDFVTTVQTHFPGDTPLIVGCRSGKRSLRAAALLQAAGFTRVVDQRGGFEGERDAFGGVVVEGWKARGLPWTADAMPGRSHAELAGALGAERGPTR